MSQLLASMVLQFDGDARWIETRNKHTSSPIVAILLRPLLVCLLMRGYRKNVPHTVFKNVVKMPWFCKNVVKVWN